MKAKQEQTATLPMRDVSNGKNYGGEKEMLSTWNVVVRDNKSESAKCEGGMRVLATVRVHVSKSKHMNYCSFWLHNVEPGNVYAAGHGTASGWGYHRPSAAMQAALDSAGVTLSRAIDGVGESAMRDALKAIARAAGYKSCLIVEN